MRKEGVSLLNGEYFVPLSRAEGLVGQSRGGGSAGSSIPFPELTVNLIIEDPEYVTEIDCAVYIKDGKRFEGFSRTYDQHDGRAPGQLVIEGGVVPCNAPQGLYIGAIYGIELSGIMVFSDSTHNYLLSVDNYVNMTAHENYDFYEITDVTKPASITVTATLEEG